MRILVALVLLGVPARAGAGTLEVRGRLTDGRGQPQDGACLLRFHLAGPSPESADLWSDALYVDVEEGLFRAVLGKDHPIPEAALAADHRVTVEPPRGTGWQALASALPEQAAKPASRTKKAAAGASAAPDETAKLKARIEALERQLEPKEARSERKTRVYEVRPGDTLQSIASKLWGDASRWSELYSANAGRIARGGELVVGQRLVVPEVDR